MILKKQNSIWLVMLVFLLAGCFSNETVEDDLIEPDENQTEQQPNNDKETAPGDGSYQNPYMMEKGVVYEGDLLDYDFSLNRSVNYCIEVTPGQEYRVTLSGLDTDVEQDYWVTLTASEGPYVEDELANERIASSDEEISFVIATEEAALDFMIQTSLTDDNMAYAIEVEKK